MISHVSCLSYEVYSDQKVEYSAKEECKNLYSIIDITFKNRIVKLLKFR